MSNPDNNNRNNDRNDNQKNQKRTDSGNDDMLSRVNPEMDAPIPVKDPPVTS